RARGPPQGVAVVRRVAVGAAIGQAVGNQNAGGDLGLGVDVHDRDVTRLHLYPRIAGGQRARWRQAEVHVARPARAAGDVAIVDRPAPGHALEGVERLGLRESERAVLREAGLEHALDVGGVRRASGPVVLDQGADL